MNQGPLQHSLGKAVLIPCGEKGGSSHGQVGDIVALQSECNGDLEQAGPAAQRQRISGDVDVEALELVKKWDEDSEKESRTMLVGCDGACL